MWNLIKLNLNRKFSAFIASGRAHTRLPSYDYIDVRHSAFTVTFQIDPNRCGRRIFLSCSVVIFINYTKYSFDVANWENECVFGSEDTVHDTRAQPGTSSQIRQEMRLQPSTHALFFFILCSVCIVWSGWRRRRMRQKCCCSHHLLEIYYFCTNYVIKIPNVYYIFSKQLHTPSTSIILSHTHARARARVSERTTLFHRQNPSTLESVVRCVCIAIIMIIINERNLEKEIRPRTVPSPSPPPPPLPCMAVHWMEPVLRIMIWNECARMWYKHTRTTNQPESTRYVCQKMPQMKTVLTGASASRPNEFPLTMQEVVKLWNAKHDEAFSVCLLVSLCSSRRADSSHAICTEWKWPTWFSNCFVYMCVCVLFENGHGIPHAHKIPSARARRHRWLNYSHVNYLVYRFYYRARTHYSTHKETQKGRWRRMGEERERERPTKVVRMKASSLYVYSCVAIMCTSCVGIPIARWIVSGRYMAQIEQCRKQREQFGNGNVCKTAT